MRKYHEVCRVMSIAIMHYRRGLISAKTLWEVYDVYASPKYDGFAGHVYREITGRN